MRGAVANDAGHATVVTAGVIAALSSVVLGLLGTGALVVASHQARNAADLAATAGAFALYREAKPCEVAAEVARLNRAELADCQLEGMDVTVTVQVKSRAATARAGPL
ncbi:hypothetical protein CPHO_01200 [Corynebacterium phocae]|uniref:Uncharacterized protein n=1 Tax=Corynebacterium phocae TaxID=161895 RepID=A0A1L7D614_9CORY|nr:hypothetical protein CPHO_01200 [Corynebacterium phocae]